MNFDNDNSIIKNKIGKCFNRDFSKEAKHSFKFVYVENPEVEEPEPKWDDEEEPRDEL